MTTKNLLDIINEIEQVPTLPQIATAVMKMLDDPDTSTRDIQDVMVQDPGLAGRILKLANSSYYGLTNKVSNLNQAIVILGFRTIRSIALSACVVDVFPDKPGFDAFNLDDFWKHSIISASVCRGLATRCANLDEEEAFVAGLLHDIGKMVILHYAPDEMLSILNRSKEDKTSFDESESNVIETTHGEIGGWLVSKWGLPEYMGEAIMHHHNLSRTTTPISAKLAAACSFSNYICGVKQIACPGNHKPPTLNKLAWETLDLDKSALPKIIIQINLEMAAAEELLRIARS